MGWVLKFCPRECNVYTSVQPHRVTPFTPVQSTRGSCPYTASTAPHSLTHSLSLFFLHHIVYPVAIAYTFPCPLPRYHRLEEGNAGNIYIHMLLTRMASCYAQGPSSFKHIEVREQGKSHMSRSLWYCLKGETGWRVFGEGC